MARSSKLVRPYDDADEADVIDVWQRAGAAAYTGIRTPFTLEQTATVFRERVRPVAEIWVGAVGADVVAFIALIGPSINRLYVDPELWRQGWGTRMIDKAKESSSGYLTVDTDIKPRPAAYFYEAQGFEVVRIDTTDPRSSEHFAVYEWRSR